MATMDSVGRQETAGTTKARVLALANEAAAWFGLAVIGLTVVFVGLAVDAWRHNNGAGEENLLSLGNPGHLIAAIGLVATSFAALGGFSMTMLRGADSAEAAIRRFLPVTAAWIAVAAIGVGSITYIGSTGVTVGHGHDDGGNLVAADTEDHHDAAGGEEGQLAAALEEEGLLEGDDGVDPSSVAGALTQGASGHPDGRHDHGEHATFTQVSTMDPGELAPLFPEGLISDSQLPELKDEIMATRAVAERLNTVEAAQAAGFSQTTNDVPFMGEHWLNYEYVRDGIFDPTKPEGLLFSTLDGEKKLVGVWFLQLPGIGDVKPDVEPVGFAGDLDLWHAHIGLCIVKLQGASEGETRESCEAKGGNFTKDLRWMMHVWVAPEGSENPDGVFAYLNGDLFEKQQAASDGGDAAPSGVVND